MTGGAITGPGPLTGISAAITGAAPSANRPIAETIVRFHGSPRGGLEPMIQEAPVGANCLVQTSHTERDNGSGSEPWRGNQWPGGRQSNVKKPSQKSARESASNCGAGASASTQQPWASLEGAVSRLSRRSHRRNNQLLARTSPASISTSNPCAPTPGPQLIGRGRHDVPAEARKTLAAPREHGALRVGQAAQDAGR